MNANAANPPHDPQLREAAEARLANMPPPEMSARPAEELLHELRVHQIELEMQNEALRQAQLALGESRDRYVDLYEFAPVGYLTLTPDGMIAEINLTAVTLLGQERNKLLHKSLRTLVAAKDQDRWVRHLLAIKNRTEKISVELSLRRGDGTVFHAQLDCVCSAAAVRITLSDITARKLIEEELRIAAVAFFSRNGMLITDPKGVILRVNAAFTQVTGYSTEEVIGKTPALLHSGRQSLLFYQQMWDTLKEKGCWQGEIWNKRKNGQIYPEMLTISAIYATEQHVTHYVGSFSDITESKEAEAEIHRLAYYDPLTKLPIAACCKTGWDRPSLPRRAVNCLVRYFSSTSIISRRSMTHAVTMWAICCWSTWRNVCA